MGKYNKLTQLSMNLKTFPIQQTKMVGIINLEGQNTILAKQITDCTTKCTKNLSDLLYLTSYMNDQINRQR